MPSPKLTRSPKDYLSTGSSLLNLALTGDTSLGYCKGDYVLLVGDSMSGKTWLSLSVLAEAARKKSFKNYQLIHDDVENGALMDVGFYFGKLAERLQEPPRGNSETVEDFYFNADDALKNGPMIYVLDSMDGLDSVADLDNFEKRKKAHDDNKETSGSYGTDKARANNNNLRTLVRKINKSDSILIIICQTRDNIGFGAQFDPKRRSGGKSLRFYANTEIWTSIRESIKKTVQGKKREVGTRTKLAIKKNRHSGQKPAIEFPIFHSYGIDDIGSCVDYLIEEKHWKGTETTIAATDLDFKGSRSKLIEHIEANELEEVVKEIVTEVWNTIAKESAPKNRKPRYE